MWNVSLVCLTMLPVLKSDLSDITITTAALLWFMFVWYIFFYYVYFQILFYLKYVSYKQHIVVISIFIQSDNLHFLVRVLNLFIFNVIPWIALLPSTILLFAFHLLSLLYSFFNFTAFFLIDQVVFHFILTLLYLVCDILFINSLVTMITPFLLGLWKSMLRLQRKGNTYVPLVGM